MRFTTGDQLDEDIDDLVRYLELPLGGREAARLRRALWACVEAGSLRPIQVQRIMYAVLRDKIEDDKTS